MLSEGFNSTCNFSGSPGGRGSDVRSNTLYTQALVRFIVFIPMYYFNVWFVFRILYIKQ